jgi:hypothetical protein
MTKVLFASKIATAADPHSRIDFIGDSLPLADLGCEVGDRIFSQGKDQKTMPMSRELYSLLATECGEDVASNLAAKLAAKADEPAVSTNMRLHKQIKSLSAQLGYDYKIGTPVRMFELDAAIAAKRGNRQPTESEIQRRLELKSLMASCGILRN